jgi:hypothetical protein
MIRNYTARLGSTEAFIHLAGPLCRSEPRRWIARSDAHTLRQLTSLHIVAPQHTSPPASSRGSGTSKSRRDHSCSKAAEDQRSPTAHAHDAGGSLNAAASMAGQRRLKTAVKAG